MFRSYQYNLQYPCKEKNNLFGEKNPTLTAFNQIKEHRKLPWVPLPPNAFCN